MTAVLRALQAADEPRRLDTLVRDVGGRESPEVARAVAVLLAQGLATRGPRGYAATKLGRRAAAPAPPAPGATPGTSGPGSRFLRS